MHVCVRALCACPPSSVCRRRRVVPEFARFFPCLLGCAYSAVRGRLLFGYCIQCVLCVGSLLFVMYVAHCALFSVVLCDGHTGRRCLTSRRSSGPSPRPLAPSVARARSVSASSSPAAHAQDGGDRGEHIRRGRASDAARGGGGEGVGVPRGAGGVGFLHFVPFACLICVFCCLCWFRRITCPSHQREPLTPCVACARRRSRRCVGPSLACLPPPWGPLAGSATRVSGVGSSRPTSGCACGCTSRRYACA